jgi:hypothetical protein
MSLDHIAATTTLDIIVVFDAFAVFVVPMFAMLTSSPVVWGEEPLWNFSVAYFKVYTFTILLLQGLGNVEIIIKYPGSIRMMPEKVSIVFSRSSQQWPVFLFPMR